MTNIPKDLIKRLVTLADDFEDAIRADERQRIACKFTARCQPRQGNPVSDHWLAW